MRTDITGARPAPWRFDDLPPDPPLVATPQELGPGARKTLQERRTKRSTTMKIRVDTDSGVALSPTVETTVHAAPEFSRPTCSEATNQQ